MPAANLRLVHPAPKPEKTAAPASAAARPGPAARVHRRPPIGQILRDFGALSDSDLARALALQRHEDARFGDILLANGMVTSDELFEALSFQHGAMVADLRAEPPDVRLIDELGADYCIRRAMLPWKRVGGATVLICSRPDEFSRISGEMPASFGRLALALAPEADIQHALITARHRALAARAETRVSEHESCRNMNPARAGRYGVALLTVLVALMVFAPLAGFALLTAWAVTTLILNSALKAGAAWHYLGRRRSEKVTFFSARHRPGIDKLPVVSILVPLYHEREIATRLVRRLERLNYPRELLDICLIVEADDLTTQATLDRARLPLWMRRVTVPRGAVRTKPRALNFALDFCRGSIIGVYDAEDAPEPEQIHRVVRRFHERGREVACLQGMLDFYNSRTNWLSRSFTIEYATWFRVILPGLEKLGFAIPLGGTTLFFRREALEDLGGWDAHNVTEDADLGIRLARRGYRTELIETVTEEEANCRLWPWVKQRSRWIKGYAMTYAVHMRSPRKLLADMGWWRFVGVQFLFLGTLSQFLLAPVLWSFWALPLGLWHPLQGVMPPLMFYGLGAVFVASELLTVSVGVVATWSHRHRFLVAWVPTLHFYYPLASIAALKGFVEIATRPFYWDKTRHGVFERSQAAPLAQPAPSALTAPASSFNRVS